MMVQAICIYRQLELITSTEDSYEFEFKYKLHMKHLNVKGYLISLLDELFVSLSVEEARFLVMLEFE